MSSMLLMHSGVTGVSAELIFIMFLKHERAWSLRRDDSGFGP